MKTTKDIARYFFGSILSLFGLISVATFVFEPVPLAQVNPGCIPTGGLNRNVHAG